MYTTVYLSLPTLDLDLDLVVFLCLLACRAMPVHWNLIADPACTTTVLLRCESAIMIVFCTSLDLSAPCHFLAAAAADRFVSLADNHPATRRPVQQKTRRPQCVHSIPARIHPILRPCPCPYLCHSHCPHPRPYRFRHRRCCLPHLFAPACALACLSGLVL